MIEFPEESLYSVPQARTDERSRKYLQKIYKFHVQFIFIQTHTQSNYNNSLAKDKCNDNIFINIIILECYSCKSAA